jgi:hypothetical protein
LAVFGKLMALASHTVGTGFEGHPLNGGHGCVKQKTPIGDFLCPFADLFRTTFPENRGNRAQNDYLFGNLIENPGIVKQDCSANNCYTDYHEGTGGYKNMRKA